MSYHGDISLGDTIDIKFTTRAFATGVPTTLAGTPVISAYPDNSITELTAGITLTVDFDTKTGLNNARVVATSGNGYAAGSNYALVITTGTVGGTSVVGEVVGSFSIAARSALRPTTAGRTLDVTAGGTAGIDWANVEAPTSVNGLTGTTISTGQAITSVSGAVGSVTGSVGSISGVTFPTNFADLSISVTTGLVDITQTAADKVWSSATRILTASTNFNDLSAAQVNAEVDTALADIHLDHLIAVADPGAIVANNSFLAKLVSASATAAFADYVNTTDSLQALRDRGDAAWATATGFSTHAAADVWTAVTRTLTAATNITSDDSKITAAAGAVTVGTNNDKTGYALSAAGIDAILDEPITEPAGVFAWGTATLRNIVGWMGALSRNKITQTATTQTLRNDADAANLATSTVSDDATTFTRGEWT